MDMLAELTTAQLLALVTINLGPIHRYSDGNWRSASQFPPAGLADRDVNELWHLKLIEWTPAGALVTEHGRSVLQAVQWWSPLAMPPARRGVIEPHPSLQ